MPRGITPIRVRRRQSDAKWRASVAMCYNIMKNVIPNQKVLGRRKVSKALTLKETERHIINLERKLRELIEDKAPCSGKTIMISDEEGNMRCATFDDIKRDFAIKQMTFFSSNTGGKKRYNIPADIEASLVNLSKQTCQLFVVNRADTKPGTSTLTRPPLVDRGQDNDFYEEFEDRTRTPRKTTSKFHIKRRVTRPNFEQRKPGVINFTPQKTPRYGCYTPKSITKQACKPKSMVAAALHNPSPMFSSQEPMSSPGFTPVKLPPEYDQGTPLMSLPGTPADWLDSPLSFLHAVTDGNNDLLCTETIDSLDNETDNLARSEEPTLVDKPKCRRRLDIGSYCQYEDQRVPEERQGQKYTSFMQLYNDINGFGEDTNSGDFIPTMYEFSEIKKSPKLERYPGYVEDTMGFSSDLCRFDIDPTSKNRIIQASDEELIPLDNSQEVPDMNLDLTAQPSSISTDLYLVPDYEDLGIIYTKDSKEDLFSFKLNYTDEVDDESEYSQVVPSF